MKTDFNYWATPVETVFEFLGSTQEGLSSAEADLRKPRKKNRKSAAAFQGIALFLAQFKNPLTLLLLFALTLSAVLGEYVESSIIFGILFFSGILSFYQERQAGRAAEKIRQLVRVKTRVRRSHLIRELPIEDVVPGDVVLLQAGDIVPADGLLIELEDLYVNEAAMTGESFPSEKRLGLLAEDTPLIQRMNSVFKGTSIISGTAVMLAVKTGRESELGKMEHHLAGLAQETAFEKGIRNFGYMLMRVALVLAGIILIINVASGKNPLESILFALALSLGLTPEMLPAIVTITLSSSAKRLTLKKVIVKRLASIQNLGAVDILCSDKTGTLTEGSVRIHSFQSAEGTAHPRIGQYAYLNALFESGYPNPMDEAIRQQLKTDISGYEKFDEVPYDFIRKRLSIVVAHDSRHTLICKGALQKVLEVCTEVATDDGAVRPIQAYMDQIQERYKAFSTAGFRTIGLAFKDVTGDPVINKDDESGLIFLGFLLLHDPLKPDIGHVLRELKGKHVDLKIITGDNVLIAQNLAAQLGIPPSRVITGPEIQQLNDVAIVAKVGHIDLFAEIEPSQKERIVRALQKKGHVVGYMGDGINDAMALKAADVGISVNNAVDVAKESADMILLEKGLDVLSEGITEGRRTYLNTLKYIFITISANFGNMISMACVSTMLPFLPLLPSQILLTNFLSDIPALSIASDAVDPEMLRKPRRWDMRLIRNFMVVFGVESSFFDFLSFGLLLFVFHATPELFRTGWFVESILSEIFILLVIRTRRTVFKSPPGAILLRSSIAVVAVTVLIPYLPFAHWIGLQPLSWPVLGAMIAVVLAYTGIAEITKRVLFKRMRY